VKEIIAAVPYPKVNVWIWRRDQNLGAAVSIYTAIEWFFQFEEEGLILEDDLAFNSDFMSFTKKCLKDFRRNKSVWLISGNQFFENELETDGPIFSHYPLIWGWATWRDRWLDIREAILKPSPVQSRFQMNPRISFWETGRNRSHSGKVDAWDIPLVSPMWNKDRFCVLPPKNLVSNMGVDGYSTHTTRAVWPLMLRTENLEKRLEDYEVSAPELSRKVDHLLTTKFYKVRRRHALLPIYGPLKDLFTPNKFKLGLQARVAEVSIPKNRTLLNGR
jgi:GR25 family glycosyltransferase involved in LPS biosynthesis